MGLFGKSADTAPVGVKPDKPKSAYPEKLETMAEEAEAEAIALAPERLAACIAQHEAFVAGYKFSCKRFGDFLTIYLTQTANPLPEYDWDRTPPREFSTTLNLAATRSITLSAGNLPDSTDEAGWSFSTVADNGKGWGGGGGGYSDPSPGWHYEVRLGWKTPWSSIPLFAEDEPKEDRHSGMCYQSNGYQIKRSIPNYPRRANPDKIYFKGIGATIYAPAGMGQGVLAAIQKEIAKGAPKRPVA